MKLARTLGLAGLAVVLAGSTALSAVTITAPNEPSPMIFGNDTGQVYYTENVLEMPALNDTGGTDPFAMLALAISGYTLDLADNVAMAVNDWLQGVRLDPTLVDYAIVAMAGLVAPFYALFGGIADGLRSAPHASARLAFGDSGSAGGARGLGLAAG